MKISITILFLFFSINILKAETAPTSDRAIVKVQGRVRLVGQNTRVIIFSCDRANQVCMYIHKVADDNNQSCVENLESGALFNQTFSNMDEFDYYFCIPDLGNGLTFYPATNISIDCQETSTIIEIETQVNLPLNNLN